MKCHELKKYYKLEITSNLTIYHVVVENSVSCFWFQVGDKDWNFIDFNGNIGGWNEHVMRIMDSDKIIEVTKLEVLVSCGSLPEQQYVTKDNEEKEKEN